MKQDKNKQRGGMILGIIVGVLVGLGVALGVALYVMKVPTPFNNKGANRTADQDVQEQKKNKNWDPNAGLSPNKPAATASEASPAAPSAALPTPASQPPAPQTLPQAAPAVASKPAPVAAQVPSASVATGDIEYQIQVGAYRDAAEAENQRGKLALAGFEGKITEREVYFFIFSYSHLVAYPA